MTDLRKAAEMLMKALDDGWVERGDNVAIALRQALAQPEQVSGDTSDGYHTFNELYDFRKAYNAALFNEWAASGKYSVHKSKRHYDGKECFGGGWFIVVAQLPNGQISNHYEMKDWDKFQLPEADKALFEYDNHTGADVLHRLFSLQPFAQPEQEPVAYACKNDVILAKRWTSDEPPSGWVSLFTTAPTKREWEFLDDDEVIALANKEGWNIQVEDFPANLLRLRVGALGMAIQKEFWRKNK